uniref:Uncharacterized protein n=1 Tax=Echinococcus granulosus TaxID=6210 RepID=A0A068WMD3_ECHGR|nr:hypothetical protein EgrG_000529600 [Echinococcus granulosus]
MNGPRCSSLVPSEMAQRRGICRMQSTPDSLSLKRSTSLVDEQGSDPPTSPIRARRKTGSVSYVVKLNTKLRQGDSNWCKY